LTSSKVSLSAADCLAAQLPAVAAHGAAGAFSFPSAARNLLPVGSAETADPALPPGGRVRALYLPWPPKALSPNVRTNRRVKAIFVRQYRKQVAEAAWAAGFTPMREPALVLARVLFRPTNARWDRDNCIAAFKAGQDGLADALGANDRTFRPEWDMGPPVKGGSIICEFDEIPA
jgi:crossover junction endodeoxyribonuclease RusA